MSWSVEFYNGVEDEVLALPTKVQAKMLRIFELMEVHGADLGAPYTKSMGKGLFEIRAKALEGIARGLFCYLDGSNIMILRVFVKKTQKTPRKELTVATKRMREIKHELTTTKA